VIATGESHSLQEFAQETFAQVSLDWRRHTDVSKSLFRPTDIAEGKGNASKAERILGWKARSRMRDVISMMIAAELDQLRTNT